MPDAHSQSTDDPTIHRPTLSDIHDRSDLLALSRQASKSTTELTIPKSDLAAYDRKGWTVVRENLHSFRVKKSKPKHEHLEHRVWSVLYKMGFSSLSGSTGATLTFDSRQPGSPTQQIDVVAFDDEVAIAIECKSYTTPRRDPLFTEKLTKHASIRGAFGQAIASTFPSESKRSVASLMVTWDLKITEQMRKRADREQVALFDVDQLVYYETLAHRLGDAARYQFLADLFQNRSIDGLKTRVPALRAKIGSVDCYTFAVQPDYLLKLCYVAHRAKGKPGDLDVYQRMLTKHRLAKLREFIADDGVFPTNIVINFDSAKSVSFHQGQQAEARSERVGGVLGWLDLMPAYGCAWIIDGQHRLYAYAGQPRARTSFLNVLAFVALPHERQTAMFVEINSEQRRVPRKLLLELDAILNWESPDDERRIAAIVSKAAMDLDHAGDSPLAGRILLQDMKRTDQRCITLPAVVGELKKKGFFIQSRTKGFTEYGFFWRTDPVASCRRTVSVVASWLSGIERGAKGWWELGAADGGGLAMNDGVAVCIRLLRSVLDHLNQQERISLSNDAEVARRCEPYAEVLGEYLGSMTLTERARFRSLRGNEGKNTRFRECQAAIQEVFRDYHPEGLEEWLRDREENVNEEARQIIDAIERQIQEHILALLMSEFGSDPDSRNGWWYQGVPEKVRQKVVLRREEKGGGAHETYFDLIDYQKIIRQNWWLCRPVFGYGSRENLGKEKGTKWLGEINECRKKVMHASRQEFVGEAELTMLRSYYEWLGDRVEAQGEGAGGAARGG